MGWVSFPIWDMDLREADSRKLGIWEEKGKRNEQREVKAAYAITGGASREKDARSREIFRGPGPMDSRRRDRAGFGVLAPEGRLGQETS